MLECQNMAHAYPFVTVLIYEPLPHKGPCVLLLRMRYLYFNYSGENYHERCFHSAPR